MKKSNDELTYTQAFDELQELVRALESGDIKVDELYEKVKRAKFLIEHCQQKLKATEDGVNELLDGMSLDNQ